MSYGSPSRCASEWVQIYFAVAKGIIPVAAAGNEFAERQPARVPGLAAARRDRRGHHARRQERVVLQRQRRDRPQRAGRRHPRPRSRRRSTATAPGRLPGARRARASAAPMVSAAMAWVRAARPELTPDRVVQAVRLTRARRAAARLGPADRLRRAQRRRRARRADRQAADPGPARAQRQPRLGERAPRSASPRARCGPAARPSSASTRLLDKQEDPVDVYRIVIPGGRSARISVIPRFGDPSLEVFRSSRSRSTTSTGASRARAGRAARRPSGSRSSTPAPRQALVLRRRSAAGQLALPGARVHPARRLAALVGAGEGAAGERALERPR